MHPELERLIDLAVADGTVTDKELEVLCRKAKQLEVDMDEFDMVLEAKLHLAQKAANTSQQPTAIVTTSNTSQKEGDVRRCPSCGATVHSFTTTCSDCGHEFRDIRASNSIHGLFTKLGEIDSELRKQHSMKSFWKQGNVELEIASSQASSISMFPVPNTKEDILEFLALASSQFKSKRTDFFERSMNGPEQRLASAWKSKCEQLVVKARLSMKNDASTLAEIDEYARQLKIT